MRVPGPSHPRHRGGVVSLQATDVDVDEAVDEAQGVADGLREPDDQFLGDELLPSKHDGDRVAVIADLRRIDGGLEAENVPDVVDVRRIADGEVLRSETQLLLVRTATPFDQDGQLALSGCGIEMRPFQDGRQTFRFRHTTP